MHKTTTVKALGDGRVGGYLIVWGDADQRDLQGEYFTPETELGLEWYPYRPVLYHHGLDSHLKSSVIGVMDTLKADATGLWAEAQLDLHRQYVQAVRRLIERGALAWSSGSLPHLVDVAADGHIKQWPIVEGSLTPTPAEPRHTNVQTVKSAYKALGLDLEPLGLGERQTNTQQENNPMENKRLPLADPQEATKAGRIEVNSPYDGLDTLDMLHGYVMLRATKRFQGVSERYANALAHKVTKSGLAAKAEGDLSATTVTGFGDDWVPDMWSTQIWQRARQDNVVLPLFRAIEMPSNPFEMPVEGTDPEVFYVPETTLEGQLSLDSATPALPGSKFGSDKVTLRASKLALRVGISAELVEDAILPVLQVYREQAVRAITNSIDYALLNGDTELDNAGNINTDAATPNATDRFLAFDGLRKLPLVTNFANAIDMAAAPTLEGLRNARFTMPGRYAARPSDLAWIVDSGTYAQLLDMEQFLTMDKAGALATAQTGQIGFVDGIPVLVSAEMPLTTVNGTVNIGGTNNKGTGVCVYRPGWFVGYRRRIAVNVEYLPYYDSYQLTATVRLAFANLDDEVASMLYNITI